MVFMSGPHPANWEARVEESTSHQGAERRGEEEGIVHLEEKRACEAASLNVFLPFLCSNLMT